MNKNKSPKVDTELAIITGTANPALASKIARRLGVKIAKADVGKFSDGETKIELLESLRGKDVFIVQPTCSPTNDTLMELVLMIDAAKRSCAETVTAVIPYYGYSRQDRRPDFTRVPISGKVVANMIQSVGATSVIAVDLHASQIQGFFDIPIVNITAINLLASDLYRYANRTVPLQIVSPDTGGVVRARNVAKQLDINDLAIIDKRRPKANVSEVMNIIGDVEGKQCIVIDDMVDTAGTLCKATKALKDNGAEIVKAYCTHAILSGAAIENINNSVLDEVVVTDTVPLSEEAEACDRIRQLTCANVIADTIERVYLGKSVSAMYVG